MTDEEKAKQVKEIGERFEHFISSLIDDFDLDGPKGFSNIAKLLRVAAQGLDELAGERRMQ